MWSDVEIEKGKSERGGVPLCDKEDAWAFWRARRGEWFGPWSTRKDLALTQIALLHAHQSKCAEAEPLRGERGADARQRHKIGSEMRKSEL